MAARSRLPPSGLQVLLDGTLQRVLSPGSRPYLFGRGSQCDLRIGHHGAGGGDRNISRTAGSIRWEDGLWLVRNDSDSRPFDIIVRDFVIPLPPQFVLDAPSVWAIGPPGVEVRIVTPTSAFLLGIVLGRPGQVVPPDESSETGPSTFSLDEPSQHDRQLLAAKFLTQPRPGDAVGNMEAAYRVNQARSPNDRIVTDKAVEDSVSRWKEKLRQLGVDGIDGRENVNHLGRQLLAYGFLRQEDRELFRPTGPSDPGTA